MKNRLTFANVINILLDNKKKTYPQHKLICDLFGEYLGKSDYSDTIYAEDNTMYSRWCTGARPIPMEILRTYEEDDKWGYMETAFDDEIIPNLINESQARSQMEELIKDSIPVVGITKTDELIAITDNAAFFTQIIRYAILSDHEHNLTNMLILAKDYDMASQVLTLYENTVLEHEGSQTFDYGICQFMNGVLALSEGVPAKAENYLLSAENIITNVMGTDNEYAKSVYKYLYNLYARWHKNEIAEEYHIKYLSVYK